ncbi:MAG: aspartate kinase [Deltaproteobacteria bacterium]|nr:aspartate kinase [Deltaproteobacteria bacterium]MBW2019161.1 aspartate kinase [Deltaproteobacteria bacterium]MBW2073964.1 aspartate kinase [Deltaproteobacteria bacterium]RLB81226.1 MAG: aspartate kinase [Deltaproteobacteria bacterium]
MALIVQKYGGTSVGDLNRIRKVAERIIKVYTAGNDVVVVLSAMAGVTDRLIQLAHQITKDPNRRELDVLLATGEQTTVSLLCIMLESMGYPAISLLGYQAEILTNRAFGRARIVEIHADRIKELLSQKKIVAVAGFQGRDQQGNITTLGRGGSDTSAVALAATLRADICEIYTDVEGVFTTDPNLCKNARKLPKISYDEMLEMASLGAKVLQIRAVEFAKKFNVPVHVRSSFKEEEGTMVVEEEKDMERVVVSGVTYSKDEARITLTRVPDQPGIASRIFTPIAEAGIVVDMIIQNTRKGGLTDLTFTVPKSDYQRAMAIQKEAAKTIGAEQVLGDEHIAKVSVIGVGMRSHSGVAAKMFTALARENINIIMISTSEIKISCVIEEKYTELAVRVLHNVFGLDSL